MLIRYGCRFDLNFTHDTPTVCLIDVHTSHARNVLPATLSFETSPCVAAHTFVDEFGNLARRFTAPAGTLKVKLDGLYRADGSLDRRDAKARVLPVDRLPAECLPYLTPSRFCESDLMAPLAWQLFGHMPRDMALVEAICDYAHSRLRFDYKHARATRTASEAHSEQVGVCRDFAHLGVALCRALNIPARYVNGYMGDIGVPPIRRRWTSTRGSTSISRAGGTRSMRGITGGGSGAFPSRTAEMRRTSPCCARLAHTR